MLTEAGFVQISALMKQSLQREVISKHIKSISTFSTLQKVKKISVGQILMIASDRQLNLTMKKISDFSMMNVKAG